MSTRPIEYFVNPPDEHRPAIEYRNGAQQARAARYGALARAMERYELTGRDQAVYETDAPYHPGYIEFVVQDYNHVEPYGGVLVFVWRHEGVTVMRPRERP